MVVHKIRNAAYTEVVAVSRDIVMCLAHSDFDRGQ